MIQYGRRNDMGFKEKYGRYALVTGASAGIGEAFARLLAKRGLDLILVARREENLNRIAEELRERHGVQVVVIPMDLTREDSAEELFRKVGEFDVGLLVNNAGFGYYAAVENLKTDDLQKIFLTNLYGSIWCTQAVVPHMKGRRSGHIVNVSTVLSRRSVPYMTGYCMTKFALNGMDEGLRIELRPFGIGVTLVCPGLTETDFQSNADRIGYAPPIRNQGGMSPAKVGRVIVRCVERNRRRVALTLSGKLLLGFQWVSPALTDEILHLAFSRKLGRSAPQP